MLRPEESFDAHGLLVDPRFQFYFKDENSPLVKEMRRLERQLTDPMVSDHLKLLQAKYQLYGMVQAFSLLEKIAADQASAEPVKTVEPASRFLAGRRLGIG